MTSYNIKVIVALLIFISMSTICMAAAKCNDCYVNVETPVYKDNPLSVTWNYHPNEYSLVNIILDQTNGYSNLWHMQTANDGYEVISTTTLSIADKLVVGEKYRISIDLGIPSNPSSGIKSAKFEVLPQPTPNPTPEPTPVITPEPPPIITPKPIIIIPPLEPRPFFGYTFGTSDCNRIAILMGQLQNNRTRYTMEIIAWDYKYNVSEMIHYCERCGANMTPITSGFREYIP